MRRALSRSGPSKVWLKAKNPASAAVRREGEEEWRSPTAVCCGTVPDILRLWPPLFPAGVRGTLNKIISTRFSASGPWPCPLGICVTME